VAAVIAGTSDSGSTVVDGKGAPVVTTNPQDLSSTQQQQAARNIGTVRTVEPEQFGGSTDDEQLANAFAALGAVGGVIRLRPGKTYTWHDAVPTMDWSKRGGVVLTAWGATVEYSGSGPAFTSTQTATIAGTQTLTVLGGEWVAPSADSFFTIIDSGNHLFYRCRGEVPNGTFVHLSNRQFWSERNHFVELEDHNCREVIRFTIDGSIHASFARTLVKDLRLQGGTAGYPKINIVTGGVDGVFPAPYDSTFDGIVGNIADGVIIARLAGGMSGTQISRIQVESQQTSTKAAVFQVGDLQGKLPVLIGEPPVLRNLLVFTDDSTTQNPFGPNVALGGVALGGALSGTPYKATLQQAGTVSVPADLCNAAIIMLNAPCTRSEIVSTLDQAASQSLTIAFQQGVAGGASYAWPSNCRFAKAKPPTDTTPMTQTSVTFVFSHGVWLEVARAEGVPIA